MAGRLSTLIRRTARQLRVDSRPEQRPQDYTSLARSARKAEKKGRWRDAARLWSQAAGAPCSDFESANAQADAQACRQVANVDKITRAIRQHSRAPATAKKRAVVTCVTGGYDRIQIPAVIDPSCHYVVFTDSPNLQHPLWEPRHVPYWHPDPTRMARFVKTHLPDLLPEFDVIVWVDANICIRSSLEPLISSFSEQPLPAAFIRHPHRESIAAEVEACDFYAKDDPIGMRELLTHFDEIGYQTDQLIESNLFMIKPRSVEVRAAMKLWWDLIDRYSRRDQLSLNFSLDTAGAKWVDVFPDGGSLRSSQDFAVTSHGKRPRAAANTLDQELGVRSVRTTRPTDRQPEADVTQAYIEGDRTRLPRSIAGLPLSAIRFVQMTPETTKNPYYEQLARSIRRAGVPIECNPNIADQFKGQRKHRLKVAHFHQFEPFYHRPTPEATWQAATDFLADLNRLNDRGWTILHTWHNPFPHDQRYRGIDEYLYEHLDLLIARCFVHLSSSMNHVAQYIARDRIHVCPHPAFTGVYGPRVPREQAVEHLQLPGSLTGPIVVSIGEIKPYKQLDLLVEGWREYQRTRPDALLVVAGKVHPEADVSVLANLPGVEFRPGFVPDSDITAYLGAADACFFAHREMWTSGAAILSRSYGVPTVFPYSEPASEYMPDLQAAVLYGGPTGRTAAESLELATSEPYAEHIRHLTGELSPTWTFDDAASTILNSINQPTPQRQ